ncbi:MAG: 50S ribosomal protein L29 [Nanoarchaeota archaeon]|nr:50S ribosomal protein L29 [Nanoarchaeota archaeon]
MKYKDIQKLSKGDREKKLKELKMELVKSKVVSSKGSGSSKTKQIKKLIARMLTSFSLENQEFSRTRNHGELKRDRRRKISSSLENKNTKETNK